jgi:hypothetical protein
MHRINEQLRKFAPPEIELVDESGDAEVQILDVVGLGSLEYLSAGDYVLIQHCYLTTEKPTASFWLPLFRGARLVVSCLDLVALTGADDFPFFRTPWGVDGDTFRDHRLRRDFAVLTTGWDTTGEAIVECYEAALEVGLPVIHLGGDFGLGSGFHVFDEISDDDLARMYGSCRYVSALRRGEGFELPALEGLACGARPICFDSEQYRHWFGDHAVYVPELPPRELREALANVFGRAPDPVTESERKEILERFDWQNVCGELWSTVLAATPSASRAAAR